MLSYSYALTHKHTHSGKCAHMHTQAATYTQNRKDLRNGFTGCPLIKQVLEVGAREADCLPRGRAGGDITMNSVVGGGGGGAGVEVKGRHSGSVGRRSQVPC